MVMPFRQHMTSHSLQTLHEGPETPTEWKSESDWQTHLTYQEMLNASKNTQDLPSDLNSGHAYVYNLKVTISWNKNIQMTFFNNRWCLDWCQNSSYNYCVHLQLNVHCTIWNVKTILIVVFSDKLSGLENSCKNCFQWKIARILLTFFLSRSRLKTWAFLSQKNLTR